MAVTRYYARNASGIHCPHIHWSIREAIRCARRRSTPEAVVMRVDGGAVATVDGNGDVTWIYPGATS